MARANWTLRKFGTAVLVGILTWLQPAVGMSARLYVNDFREVCHLPRPGQNGAVIGHDIGWSSRIGSTVYWSMGDLGVDINGDGLPGPGLETAEGGVATSTDDDPSDCIDLTYKINENGRGMGAVPLIAGECTTWPAGAVEANGFVYLYYASVPAAVGGGCNYSGNTTNLARFTDTETLATERRGTIFTAGSGGFTNPIKIGSHVYLFSGAGGGGPRVVRVLESLIENAGAYEYWQGGNSWSGTSATAEPLFSAAGGGSVTVSFDQNLSRYLALFSCNVATGGLFDFANGLCARIADQVGSSEAALVGSWGDEALLHHCRNDQNLNRCYQGAAHAAYSVPGGATYVTSARREIDELGRGFYWVTLREFQLGTQAEFPLREYYLADHGTSSAAGKQGWSYQAGPLGPPLTFEPFRWIGSELVGTESAPRIQGDISAPGPTQPAVRVWTAPIGGTARVSGEVWVERTCSDGVGVSVLKVVGTSIESLWSQNVLPGQSALLNQDGISVEEGDRLAFQVEMSGSSAECDATRFNPTIRFDPERLRRVAVDDWRDGSPGLISAQPDGLLLPMQGYRGWSYEECTFTPGSGLSGCAPMTTRAQSAQAWEGPSGPSSRLFADGGSAPTTPGKVVARAWTAPAGGTVLITGSYAESCGPGGSTDGVQLGIFNGLSTRIWGMTAVPPGGAGTFSAMTYLDGGEVLRFVIERGGPADACNEAIFAPVIEATTGCAPAPVAGCRTAVNPQKPYLVVKDGTDARRDLLQWTWRGGEATDLGAFGDPLVGLTRYYLCVYDRSGGQPVRVSEAALPGGGTCRGLPCWRPLSGGRGYRYDDRELTPHGIQKVFLKTGDDGVAEIAVKGKGSLFPLPPLPFAQDPNVTVQLVSTDGECWTADYPAPAARNDIGGFKDFGG
jgi:hypothetical protein